MFSLISIVCLFTLEGKESLYSRGIPIRIRNVTNTMVTGTSAIVIPSIHTHTHMCIYTHTRVYIYRSTHTHTYLAGLTAYPMPAHAPTLCHQVRE